MVIQPVFIGKVALQKKPVDLMGLIRGALDSTQPAFDARGHALSTRRAPGTFILDGDPTRPEQLFCNLLLNAARYTPPGGQIALNVARE